MIEDAANKAASAIAGAAAAADDPSVSGGTIGKVTDLEVGGVKPFHILTLGIAKVIGELLAGDLIGSQEFFIPAANISAFADPDKFKASLRTDPDVPFDVQMNWPPTFQEEAEFLFNQNGATYKVYFVIRGIPITEPVPLPPLH